MTLPIHDRCDRLDLYIAEGRVISHKWTSTDECGRHMACLLAALVPEVVFSCENSDPGGDPERCPADVMPPWLARLTPHLDDEVTEDVWPAMIRRYAAVARRWHVLSDAAWRRCEFNARRAAVMAARDSTEHEAVRRICAKAIALCDREIAGDAPSYFEWQIVRSFAFDLDMESDDIEPAAAARSVAAATRDSSWSVTEAADHASIAAAAGGCERVHVWNRIADATLDAIEHECDQAG